MVISKTGDFTVQMVDQGFNPIGMDFSQGSTKLTMVTLTPKRQGDITKPSSISVATLISY
jgi:hypothetical protein